MWPLISAQFWLDAIGISRTALPIAALPCAFILLPTCSSCLQMLWTSKIINGVVSTVRGRGGDGANAKVRD